jgi:hypothetical protein
MIPVTMDSTSCGRLAPRISAGLIAFFLSLAALSAQTVSPAPLVVRDLGRATIPVDGTWQFHTGDDLAWAAPSYDDAGWAPIRTGLTREEQGYRNYTGFAWYRRQIVLATSTNSDWQLALLLPNLEDAAEVYWNGRRLGSFGKVPPHPVWYGMESPAFPRGRTGRGDGWGDGVGAHPAAWDPRQLNPRWSHL